MRLFQKFFICAFIICFAVTAFGQSEYRPHMLVKVMPETEARLKALYLITQLDIVPGETREEPCVVAHPEDLELLESEGYAYVIIHENLEKFYADRLGRRLDDLPDELAPRGHKEQRLATDVHLAEVVAQQHVADAVADNGTAGVLGEDDFGAGLGEGPAQHLELRALPAAVGTVEDDEPAGQLLSELTSIDVHNDARSKTSAAL